jgi:hypothetical protein
LQESRTPKLADCQENEANWEKKGGWRRSCVNLGKENFEEPLAGLGFLSWP